MQLHPEHTHFLEQLKGLVLGANIGKGFVKMRCGNLYLPEVPAIVALVNSTISYEEFFRDDDIIIEHEGRWYAVGHAASRLGVSAQADLSDDRLMSNDYLLLLLACVSQFFHARSYTPERVVLVVPLSSYNNDREMIKKLLSGKHEIGIVKGGEVVRKMTIMLHEDRLSVIPEGRGTLASLTITEAGLPHDPDDYGGSRIGVINGGTGTTEALGFEELMPVKSATDKLNVGMSKVWMGIMDFAGSVHNYDMSRYEANVALQRGYFYVGSKKVYIHDVAPDGYGYGGKDDPGLRNTLVGEQAKQIGNMVASVWQSGKWARAIPCSGGFSPYLYPFLEKRLPHVFVVKNPVQAEASGAYLYGIMKILSSEGIFDLYRGMK